MMFKTKKFKQFPFKNLNLLYNKFWFYIHGKVLCYLLTLLKENKLIFE